MRDEALLSTAADTQNKINMSSCSDNRTRRSWADVASDDSGETSNAPSIIKEFLDADEVPEELLEVERKGEATVVVGKSRDHGSGAAVDPRPAHDAEPNAEHAEAESPEKRREDSGGTSHACAGVAPGGDRPGDIQTAEGLFSSGDENGVIHAVPPRWASEVEEPIPESEERHRMWEARARHGSITGPFRRKPGRRTDCATQTASMPCMPRDGAILEDIGVQTEDVPSENERMLPREDRCLFLQGVPWAWGSREVELFIEQRCPTVFGTKISMRAMPETAARRAAKGAVITALTEDDCRILKSGLDDAKLPGGYVSRTRDCAPTTALGARQALFAAHLKTVEERHVRMMEACAQDRDDALRKVSVLEAQLAASEEDLATAHAWVPLNTVKPSPVVLSAPPGLSSGKPAVDEHTSTHIGCHECKTRYSREDSRCPTEEPMFGKPTCKPCMLLIPPLGPGAFGPSPARPSAIGSISSAMPAPKVTRVDQAQNAVPTMSIATPLETSPVTSPREQHGSVVKTAAQVCTPSPKVRDTPQYMPSPMPRRSLEDFECDTCGRLFCSCTTVLKPATPWESPVASPRSPIILLAPLTKEAKDLSEKHGLDSKAREKLGDLPSEVQKDICDRGIREDIKRPSAWVTRLCNVKAQEIENNWSEEPWTWAEWQAYGEADATWSSEDWKSSGWEETAATPLMDEHAQHDEVETEDKGYEDIAEAGEHGHEHEATGADDGYCEHDGGGEAYAGESWRQADTGWQ